MWKVGVVVAAMTCVAALSTGCRSGSSGAQAEVSTPTGMLRHVVHFRFQDDVTDEQIRGIEEAFAALPDRIPSIRGYEWGHTDISVEELHRDFTHVFIVTFDDVAGLEAYLPHPAHEEFVERIDPLLDDVFVTDYIVRSQHESNSRDH